MKLSKFHVESLLLEIRGEIKNLNSEEDFRQEVLEDVELAAVCFKEKNIIALVNCLAVLADELQTEALFASRRDPALQQLLGRIHRLQRMMIKLPVSVMGQSGGTIPDRPAGSRETAETMGAAEPVVVTSTVTATVAAAESSPMAGAVEYGELAAASAPAGTPTVITSAYPVSHFSLPQPLVSQTNFFDFSTHVIIYCGSNRKR